MLYRDRYYGGEPFSGAEVVFLNGIPGWTMNFFGSVNKESLDLSGSIYSFLRHTLSKVSSDIPFRGPKEFKNEEYTYINKVNGDIEHFEGRESILIKDKEVYHAYYHGGFINIIPDERADNIDKV